MTLFLQHWAKITSFVEIRTTTVPLTPNQFEYDLLSTGPLRRKFYTVGQNNRWRSGAAATKVAAYPSQWMISGTVTMLWEEEGEEEAASEQRQLQTPVPGRWITDVGPRASPLNCEKQDLPPLSLSVSYFLFSFWNTFCFSLFSLLPCSVILMSVSCQCPWWDSWILALFRWQTALCCCVRSQYAKGKQRNVSFHGLL